MEMDMNKPLMLIAAITLMASAEASVAQDVENGKKLYVDNCQSCHGGKGEGAVGLKLAGDAAYWDFAIFKRTVMEGLDDEGKQMKIMPVMGKTGFLKPAGAIPTDAELQDIQAYTKTFAPAE
jgi:mono/diheme cytochrome c family protein